MEEIVIVNFDSKLTNHLRNVLGPHTIAQDSGIELAVGDLPPAKIVYTSGGAVIFAAKILVVLSILICYIDSIVY